MKKCVLKTGSIELNESPDLYIFCYKDTEFKILKVSFTNKYLTFIHQNSANDVWLNKLNHYSILKTPNIEKLIKKFIILANKYFINIDDKTSMTLDKLYSNKTIAYQHEYFKFKNILNNFNNNVLLVTNDINYNIKYTNSIISQEYINTWKYLYDKSLGTLELNNDCPFEWIIKFNNFNSIKLNEELSILNVKKKYNTIDILFYINKLHYPNQPPTLKVIKPQLKNSLTTRLANTKMLNLDYWDPSTSFTCIIKHIYDSLNKYASIDFNIELDENNLQYTKITKIENILMNLSSLTTINTIDEIDKDLNLNKFSDIIKQFTKNNSNVDNKYWKSGTGFGYNGLSKWDPIEYTKLQEKRNNKINDVLDTLLTFLQQNTVTCEICKLIEKSILINYFIEQLCIASFMYIDKHFDTYITFFKILNLLVNIDGIYLYNIKVNNTTLYNIMFKLADNSIEALQLDDTNKTAMTIYELWTILSSLYEKFILLDENLDSDSCSQYSDNNSRYSESKSRDSESKSHDSIIIETTSINQQYVDTLSKYRISYLHISNSDFHYDVPDGNYKKCFKRLSGEIPTLKDSLPIDYNASIFAAIDKTQPNKQQYLITGPIDTPYQNGCFIFDAYMSNKFPDVPPDFWFRNTGGHRFSPNLYDSGKVCISVLNTYIGPAPDKSELWIPTESTLYQVVISILGQILIEEPYFCEPGYEASINTDYGKKNSKIYNNNIRLYTMETSIRDLLINPGEYPQFKDVIINHFKFKKNDILRQCEYWVDDIKNLDSLENSKQQYKKYGNKTKTQILKEKYEKIYNEIKEAYKQDIYL